MYLIAAFIPKNNMASHPLKFMLKDQVKENSEL
jgi:hypothetical protein